MFFHLDCRKEAKITGLRSLSQFQSCDEVLDLSVWLAILWLDDNHKVWHNLTLKLPRVMYDIHCLLLTIRPLLLLLKETYELSASLHESFFGKHLVLSSIPKLGKPGQTKRDVCAHNISSSLSIPNHKLVYIFLQVLIIDMFPSTGNMPIFSH